jgi:hypothetical protein
MQHKKHPMSSARGSAVWLTDNTPPDSPTQDVRGDQNPHSCSHHQPRIWVSQCTLYAVHTPAGHAPSCCDRRTEANLWHALSCAALCTWHAAPHHATLARQGRVLLCTPPRYLLRAPSPSSHHHHQQHAANSSTTTAANGTPRSSHQAVTIGSQSQRAVPDLSHTAGHELQHCIQPPWPPRRDAVWSHTTAQVAAAPRQPGSCGRVPAWLMRAHPQAVLPMPRSNSSTTVEQGCQAILPPPDSLPRHAARFVSRCHQKGTLGAAGRLCNRANTPNHETLSRTGPMLTTVQLANHGLPS